MDTAIAAVAAALAPKATTTKCVLLEKWHSSMWFFVRNKWSEKKNYSGQYHYDWNCCVCSRHLLKYGTISKHWLYACILLLYAALVFSCSSSLSCVLCTINYYYYSIHIKCIHYTENTLGRLQKNVFVFFCKLHLGFEFLPDKCK